MRNEHEAFNIVNLVEESGVNEFHTDHDNRVLYIKDIKKFANYLGLELTKGATWFMFVGWNVVQGIPQKMDRYNKQIMDLLERQERKGVSKYGQRLENNTDGIIARLNHLEEELADALRYIQWIKDWLEGNKNE